MSSEEANKKKETWSLQRYIKEKSFVNSLLFPAPKPAQYTKDAFPRQLCWIPRDFNETYERDIDEISEDDDNRIPCLWLPYPRQSRRIIIYAHGNGEDLGNTHRFLRSLRDNLRCHMLALEYPGYGISPGVPTEATVNRDMMLVYDFVRTEMGFDPEDIILFGRSIGSGPSCHLAARYPVGGLILVSAFSCIRDMVRHLAGKVAATVVADRFTNVESVEQITVPVLFIHGVADTLIPYSHSKTLFRHATKSERRGIHFPEEMDHNRFDLKEDIVEPITVHFKGYFTRGIRNYKDIMPSFAFLKPDEYRKQRDKLKEEKKEEYIPTISKVSPSKRPKKESPEATPSPTRSLAGAHTSRKTKRASYEYEKQLAHLLMMHPQLGEAEGKKILNLTRGNLPKAVELILKVEHRQSVYAAWH